MVERALELIAQAGRDQLAQFMFFVTLLTIVTISNWILVTIRLVGRRSLGFINVARSAAVDFLGRFRPDQRLNYLAVFALPRALFTIVASVLLYMLPILICIAAVMLALSVIIEPGWAWLQSSGFRGVTELQPYVEPSDEQVGRTLLILVLVATGIAVVVRHLPGVRQVFSNLGAAAALMLYMPAFAAAAMLTIFALSDYLLASISPRVFSAEGDQVILFWVVVAAAVLAVPVWYFGRAAFEGWTTAARGVKLPALWSNLAVVLVGAAASVAGWFAMYDHLSAASWMPF